MKPPPPSPPPPAQEVLKVVSYDDTVVAEPPIPITVATPPPKTSPNGLNGIRHPKNTNQGLSPSRAQIKLVDDVPRGSGHAPSSFTTRDSRTTLGTDVESTSSIRNSPSLSAPDDAFRSQNPKSRLNGVSDESSNAHNDSDPNSQLPFMGLLTEIPTGSFEDFTIPGQVQFSKRGSMLIGGKKANCVNGSGLSQGRVIGSRREPNGTALMPTPQLSSRVLSADDEALSSKVRSMYEGGGGKDSEWVAGMYNKLGNGKVEADSAETIQPLRHREIPEILTNGFASHNSPPGARTAAGRRESALVREEHELAGGIEDWEDLSGGDVDRYGFIVPRKLASQASSMISRGAASPEPGRLQRMSTLLQLASEAPRRNPNRLSRVRSSKSPARSVETPSSRRAPSTIIRPASSQSSYRTINGKESRLRSAANRLPHNRDRRCVDEAGDMLTLPPGLANIAEDEEDGKAADDLRRKEWEREDKWQKMAKVVKKDSHGGGTVFEFDTKSPKVIERTWKGIPDRWRATAWHAFLSASAKRRKGCLRDTELIAIFQNLVTQGSPDDMQIDIDVPRTISSHIMFRRRYRGGQRLLFRVLHSLSIYFPDTGYVQGMAALAATLLCYFDEEMTFVMLVRLWQLRGLERLYQKGFEGLMQALEEFEKHWLGKAEVAARLTEFGISATAYGTRWYLTLFNYSIPFPAQLRVWDVFMLLGDPDTLHPLPPLTQPSAGPSASTVASSSFHGQLDVLHATSAALVDGVREILLDSDFENAMKVLTSWIPIKDEEMLMRVARVEWKKRRRRKT